MLGVLKNKAVVVASITLVASVVLTAILIDTKEKITPLRGEVEQTTRTVELGPDTVKNAQYDEDAYVYTFDIEGTKKIGGLYDINSIPFDLNAYDGTYVYGADGLIDFTKEDSIFECGPFDNAMWFKIEFKLIKRATVDVSKSVMTFTNISTSTTSYIKVKYEYADEEFNYYCFELNGSEISSYLGYGNTSKLEALKLVFSC